MFWVCVGDEVAFQPQLGLPGSRPEQMLDAICQFHRLCLEHVRRNVELAL